MTGSLLSRLQKVDTALSDTAGQCPGVFDVPVQFRPEPAAVVVNPGVYELGDYNVVHQLRGEHHQFYVEADVVTVRAATPTGPLVPYENPIVLEAVSRGQLLQPVLDLFRGGSFVDVGKRISQGAAVVFLTPDSKLVLLHPGLFQTEELKGLFEGSMCRNGHPDAPIVLYGDDDTLGPGATLEPDGADAVDVENS